jgi:hypothetical protein
MNILPQLTAPLRARIRITLALIALTGTGWITAANHRSELFTNLRPVYSDSFDGGSINTNFWEIRQHSTWTIRDGVLTGSQSSKEFQEKMIAKGDRAHAGFKPVIWLKQVPETFVCTLRLRYRGKDYHPRFPLLDIGHHIHTLTFGADQTTLTIRKNVETVKVPQPRLKLDHWHNIAIELKRGILHVSIDGRKHVFRSPHIDMSGHAQIDFKGIDFGTCEIDDVNIWEGR